MNVPEKPIPSKSDLFAASLIGGQVASFTCIVGLLVLFVLENHTILVTPNMIEIFGAIASMLVNGFVFGLFFCSPIGFLMGLVFRQFYNHGKSKLILVIISVFGVNIPLFILVAYLKFAKFSLDNFGIGDKELLQYALIFAAAGLAAGMVAKKYLDSRIDNRQC